MTKTEKLKLIKLLVTNIAPYDFTNKYEGAGAALALSSAIECVMMMEETDES